MTNALTLQEIAELCSCELIGDPNKTIAGASTLKEANSNQASFLSNPRYTARAQDSQAGVIFVSKHAHQEEGKNYLISSNPSQAFQKLLDHFYKDYKGFSSFEEGIHPLSIVHSQASIGKNVNIGPHCVIDADVSIGDHCIIGAGAYIAKNVEIGDGSLIHANVTLREGTKIGKRVIIQPGAVIGSCGFGFMPNKEGEIHKLSQLGGVIIEDDVEIGANTTIDRARVGNTRIGRGTKIDNLVQIAHGVQIGENNLIVAQCGFAGSSQTGNNVTFAGQSGINGHISIAPHTTFAARSGVIKSIERSGQYGGFPAKDIDTFRKEQVYIKKLDQLYKRVAELEKKQKTSV